MRIRKVDMFFNLLHIACKKQAMRFRKDLMKSLTHHHAATKVNHYYLSRTNVDIYLYRHDLCYISMRHATVNRKINGHLERLLLILAH